MNSKEARVLFENKYHYIRIRDENLVIYWYDYACELEKILDEIDKKTITNK